MLFKIDGAQICSRLCMCIEFAIQVSKQKSARVLFPVGMVYLDPSAFPESGSSC